MKVITHGCSFPVTWISASRHGLVSGGRDWVLWFLTGDTEAGGGWHREDLALLSFSGHQRVNMRCHGETLDKDSLPALIGHITGVVQMFSDVNLGYRRRLIWILEPSVMLLGASKHVCLQTRVPESLHINPWSVINYNSQARNHKDTALCPFSSQLS